MNSKRTSLIWKIPEKEFKDVIRQAHSYSHALSYFGLQNKGGNSKTLKKRICELKLSTSHFLSRSLASTKTRQLSKEQVIETLLIENCLSSRSTIKKYIIRHELLDYKCESCLNLGEWMGKRISLQLEHKNGVSDDNRLENLCFLCPNCHSQTGTYAGKNAQRSGGGGRSRSDSTTFKELGAGLLHYSPREKKCQCGQKISKSAKACRSCSASSKNVFKIVWPSPDAMAKLLWDKPTSTIAKELGVSDNAVANFCKKYGLQKPSRGYWTTKKDIPQIRTGEDNHKWGTGKWYEIENLKSGEKFQTNHLKQWAEKMNLKSSSLRAVAFQRPLNNRSKNSVIPKQHKGFVCRLIDPPS